ncbi:hypothetical protein VNO77_05338 [Canavalia gladiata]|uniref:Uncharacterized protein n=1 Tax=Canavalia gladiata TaxID=3824 RepID=A0AAN9N075_CANGL
MTGQHHGYRSETIMVLTETTRKIPHGCMRPFFTSVKTLSPFTSNPFFGTETVIGLRSTLLAYDKKQEEYELLTKTVRGDATTVERERAMEKKHA